MKIYHSIDEFVNENVETTVLIGSFDGLHLGHKWVLNQLKAVVNQTNTKSVVLTFSPHPNNFFNPNSNFKLLSLDDEKVALFSKQGIDYLILQSFDSYFSQLSAETLLKKLVDVLHMKYLLMGYDHSFGKNKEGTLEFVNSFQEKYGFRTILLNIYKNNEIAVSSSMIRELLHAGEIQKANALLGYTYFISGTVTSGNKLGRTIGFPTANITIGDANKLLPKQGVYVVKSEINGHTVFGMMNIGFRPTVAGKNQTLEVYFFDFKQDIYGDEIKIFFLQRLRNEQKFASIDALKEQLKLDEKQSRELITKYLN